MRHINSLLLVFAVAAVAQAGIHDGLINYWTLDGDFNDTAASIPGNTSTFVDNGTQPAGAVTYGTGFLGGNFASFDGTDAAYVEVPDSADIVAAGESLSISAWFQVTSLDDGWQGLVAHGESSDYRLASRGSDNVISTRLAAGDIPTSAIGPDITDGAWHHVVATGAIGGQQEIWVDGALVESNAYDSITDNGSGRLMIGGNPDTGPGFRTWNGGIDDVGMWDRGLSAAEIGQIYANGVAGSPLSVPEPGTGLLALMAAGGLGLLRRRR